MCTDTEDTCTDTKDTCTDTEDTCTDTEDTCTDTIVLCRMFSSSEYFSEIDKFHGFQHGYTSRITLHHFFWLIIAE